jgi:16S rRNA (cytosine1402-N4)-methyltransferase
VKNFLQYHKLLPVDGLLVDLGVSSHQFDVAERGFSTRFDAPLDMRMSRDAKLTAMKVVNEYPEEALRRIFSEYGELQNARAVARKIVESRKTNPVETTKQLKELLSDKAEWGAEAKFYAKLFQALRIEVNEELEALKELLLQCNDIIKKDGRLVVISYHSLEDRMVKNFIATGTIGKEVEKDILTGHIKQTSFRAWNKKPIEPSDEEIEMNPRARSAKMRVAIKN